MALLGGWLVGWTIRGIIERHLNFKVGTPSASHNSAITPCGECAHNNQGDGHCADWPLCTVVYDKFTPKV